MTSDEAEDFATSAAGATASPFPDDVISTMLRRLIRAGGLLEGHDQVGVQASLSEIMAIRELAEAPGLAQNDLAERLGLEKSTVSRLVTGLERHGWVRRDRDPANRRYLRLSLTAEGEATARRIGRHLHEHHRALLSGLTSSELEALAVGLSALARVVGEHRVPGRPALPAPGPTAPHG
jgi:DNA-binding MarR family transcriptional regulator